MVQLSINASNCAVYSKLSHLSVKKSSSVKLKVHLRYCIVVEETVAFLIYLLLKESTRNLTYLLIVVKCLLFHLLYLQCKVWKIIC